MLRRLLNADRGEPGLAIVRACRKQGLRSVGVYARAARAGARVLGADRARLSLRPAAGRTWERAR